MITVDSTKTCVHVCVRQTSMWASCCNWLCMDSADSEQTGESEQRRHHQQSYSNSAFNTQSPPPEHTCKACGGCIDTAAKKVSRDHLNLSCRPGQRSKPCWQLKLLVMSPLIAQSLATILPQHVCVDCKNYYCSRCSAQLEPRPCLCHTCQRFYGNLLERTELMKLKVKELRDYLHLHQVSTHLCREKVWCDSLTTSMPSRPWLGLNTVSCPPGGACGVGPESTVLTVQWLCPRRCVHWTCLSNLSPSWLDIAHLRLDTGPRWTYINAKWILRPSLRTARCFNLSLRDHTHRDPCCWVRYSGRWPGTNRIR